MKFILIPTFFALLFIILAGAIHYHDNLKNEHENHIHRKNKIDHIISQHHQEKTWRQQHAPMIIESQKKRWGTPTPRLLVADWLDNLLEGFEEGSYSIEPDSLITLDDSLVIKGAFLRLKIITTSDIKIYTLYQKLWERFPGTLIPKGVALKRNPENRIEGVLTFIWCLAPYHQKDRD